MVQVLFKWALIDKRHLFLCPASNEPGEKEVSGGNVWWSLMDCQLSTSEPVALWRVLHYILFSSSKVMKWASFLYFSPKLCLPEM